MWKSDIKVGSLYQVKISGGVTTVKVNSIEEVEGKASKAFAGKIKLTEYHCTNMETGRRIVLRSVAKFIKQVNKDTNDYSYCQSGCRRQELTANKPWICLECRKRNRLLVASTQYNKE